MGLAPQEPVQLPLSLPETRPLARGSVTTPSMASTGASGTSSRPHWQQSARVWPRGMTSPWRYAGARWPAWRALEVLKNLRTRLGGVGEWDQHVLGSGRANAEQAMVV